MLTLLLSYVATFFSFRGILMLLGISLAKIRDFLLIAMAVCFACKLLFRFGFKLAIGNALAAAIVDTFATTISQATILFAVIVTIIIVISRKKKQWERMEEEEISDFERFLRLIFL